MVLKADSAVYGGYVIARDGGVVFVKGAVPGELVEVSVTEKKKDYCLARVTDVIEPSPFRVEPPCRHFGECGGCQLQFISYEEQVRMKEEILLDCMRRIGGLDVKLDPPVTGGAFNYRRRAQFKVSKEGAIGFYREGTRDVVPIGECPLMTGRINSALKNLRACNLSGIKEVHVTCGDCMVALIKGRGFDGAQAEAFLGAGFSGVAFEDRSRSGAGHVGLELQPGLTYTVSPWAFFQSNWDLNVMAAGIIADGLMPLEGKKVIYLYAGAGNFALPLAREAKEVVAVEENPDSIKDGERNLKINNIGNFRFINQKAEKANLKGDIVIVDPPRPGLADRVVKMLLEASPEKIAYVSCNPSTLARDLKKLALLYDITSIRMMDFFPHTYHIETLAFLTRKR
ncbi:MAG: class I SAM-dependent RNA methyltransferase [Thermodesulfovibrionales bacterium]|nr:class I SAM-dependent RNA methyltransferase [Thermodesulfovibrionales bacterium]